MTNRTACVLLAMSFAACSRNVELPTGPTTSTEPPSSSTVGGIGGYVFAVSDGACLVGARVEVADGPKAGEALVQKDCPFGDAYGYSFNDLPINTLMTIRASAPGYKPVERQMNASVQVGQSNFILPKE